MYAVNHPGYLLTVIFVLQVVVYSKTIALLL
jgi:hypothetical protein